MGAGACVCAMEADVGAGGGTKKAHRFEILKKPPPPSPPRAPTPHRIRRTKHAPDTDRSEQVQPVLQPHPLTRAGDVACAALPTDSDAPSRPTPPSPKASTPAAAAHSTGSVPLWCGLPTAAAPRRRGGRVGRCLTQRPRREAPPAGPSTRAHARATSATSRCTRRARARTGTHDAQVCLGVPQVASGH